MPHVFISYSRKDTDFVEKLERDLNARGIVTWRDKTSIVGSEDWYVSIVRGLENATAVILVVTPNADESRWVRREALYADELGVHTIPIWPERYAARLNLHFLLIEKQPIYCDGSDYASGLVQLIAKLGDLSETTPAARRVGVPLEHDRAAEIAYLDFVLSEMKAELRTARYVNLGATRENAASRKPSLSAALDEFEMSFDRFEPLVKAECLYGEDLDHAGEPVDDARDALREMGRAILLGEPGSGKTTTLQQLTIDLARSAQDNRAAPLPVFVPLRSYSGEKPFSEFVRGQLGPLQSHYERLLAEGQLLLLCDALNEMKRHANERDMVDEVCDYLRDRQSWVISCRVRDYQEELRDLPDVGKVRLKPLDLLRIKDVIDRRFSAKPERAVALWADLGGSDELLQVWLYFGARGKEDEFWHRKRPDQSWLWRVEWSAWEAMHDDPRRMMSLCRNPFMLFMVCGTFERLWYLPPNRGALFATFVDNLLRREEKNSNDTGRAWIDAQLIRHGLAALAYAMQKSETGTEITRIEALQILNTQSDVSDPMLMLRLAASASLLDVGERVRYTHQLLQEYFASEVMGTAMDEERPSTEFWPAEDWWEQQGWEETAIILAGVRGDAERVAHWIASAQPELAYRVLTESGIEVSLETIATDIIITIVESARAKTQEENSVGRAAAYRILGVFDADKRSGVGLQMDGLPEIDWVRIPEGEFVYGDDNEGNGPREVILPAFYIARYPVTYKQFQAFVDANDGFGNPQWWEGLATSDLHRTVPGEQSFKFWNHPRENVSWYDAVAFCRWLSAKMGIEVRLPTEQEWEKAARGVDGRRYPYGNDFSKTGGNTWLANVHQTTAVGIFPKGASPFGVYDTSGNVAEWCLNLFERPQSIGLNEREARVLRGGSWEFDDYSDLQVSCVDRIYGPSDLRTDYFGFRIVCAHPI